MVCNAVDIPPASSNSIRSRLIRSMILSSERSPDNSVAEQRQQQRLDQQQQPPGMDIDTERADDIIGSTSTTGNTRSVPFRRAWEELLASASALPPPPSHTGGRDEGGGRSHSPRRNRSTSSWRPGGIGTIVPCRSSQAMAPSAITSSISQQASVEMPPGTRASAHAARVYEAVQQNISHLRRLRQASNQRQQLGLSDSTGSRSAAMDALLGSNDGGGQDRIVVMDNQEEDIPTFNFQTAASLTTNSGTNAPTTPNIRVRLPNAQISGARDYRSSRHSTSNGSLTNSRISRIDFHSSDINSATDPVVAQQPRNNQPRSTFVAATPNDRRVNQQALRAALLESWAGSGRNGGDVVTRSPTREEQSFGNSSSWSAVDSSNGSGSTNAQSMNIDSDCDDDGPIAPLADSFDVPEPQFQTLRRSHRLSSRITDDHQQSPTDPITEADRTSEYRLIRATLTAGRGQRGDTRLTTRSNSAGSPALRLVSDAASRSGSGNMPRGFRDQEVVRRLVRLVVETPGEGDGEEIAAHTDRPLC